MKRMRMAPGVAALAAIAFWLFGRRRARAQQRPTGPRKPVRTPAARQRSTAKARGGNGHRNGTPKVARAGGTKQEPTAADEDVDLLITEGYKREKMPKIEVVRKAVDTELLCRQDPDLIAVATDASLEVHVPVFRLNDPLPIADFIEKRFLGQRG